MRSKREIWEEFERLVDMRALLEAEYELGRITMSELDQMSSRLKFRIDTLAWALGIKNKLRVERGVNKIYMV